MPSEWKVEFVAGAKRDLKRLSRLDQERVIKFLTTRIATRENPRRIGHPLGGPLAGYWTYRVGDIRVIAEIADGILTVLVVQIGNRREVYR